MPPQQAAKAPQPSPAVDPKYLLDLTKQAFYKRHFGSVLVALMVLAISNVVLMGGFVWVKNQRVEREYFAVEQGTGRLIRMPSMAEPHLVGANLLTWVQTCITQANTYDFVNYQAQFMKNKDCFTTEGWSQFQSAMERAGTLDVVKNQRLVATSVANGAPVILQEGLFNGAYAWQIQIPITVTYQGGQGGRSMVNQQLMVKALVTNVAPYISKEGVGIAQYIATER
ncbi:MAG: type IV secretion protein IcmL [Burkholderiaceae bacterium]|nr:MAG: type IV secretion protein IcmL [Burkholderiaceae bacterium]